MGKKDLDQYHYRVYSPWMKLKSYNWEFLISDANLKTYDKNEIIYYQEEYNDFAYIVKKGRVRISFFSPDGDVKVLTIVEEGSMFGELSIMDDLPNMVTAKTIVESQIYQISKKTFINKLKNEPEIAFNISKNLARKVRLLSSQIQDLSFSDSKTRVISTLIKLSENHGNIIDGDYMIDVKFTHQEMANLTGLCRVTVSNIMSELSNEGFICKKSGHVIVKNIEKLKEKLNC